MRVRKDQLEGAYRVFDVIAQLRANADATLQVCAWPRAAPPAAQRKGVRLGGRGAHGGGLKLRTMLPSCAV